MPARRFERCATKCQRSRWCGICAIAAGSKHRRAALRHDHFNPPYVAAEEPHLQQGDLRFEPAPALASGNDGLADIRQIVAGSADYLRSGGWLLFEHGYDQAHASRDLLVDTGFVEVFARADIAGLSRVAGGRLLTSNSSNR
jgi:hypothetical protein